MKTGLPLLNTLQNKAASEEAKLSRKLASSEASARFHMPDRGICGLGRFIQYDLHPGMRSVGVSRR